jgi:hypothetical protein
MPKGGAAPLRKAPMATDNSFVINGHCLSQMPKGGLEPPRVAPYAPQTYVSTSSTTSALEIYMTGTVFISSRDYFFSGDATGEAAGFDGVDGEAAGSAPPAGGTEGEAAGLGEGEGWVAAPLSRTTELGSNTPGSEKSSARNIKSAAATTVAFSSGFCAPRGPKAV